MREVWFKEHKREFYSFFFFFKTSPFFPSRKRKSIQFTMKPPFPPPTQSPPNPSIFPPLRPSTPTQTFSAAQTQLPKLSYNSKTPNPSPLLQSGPWAPVFSNRARDPVEFGVGVVAFFVLACLALERWWYEYIAMRGFRQGSSRGGF